MDYGVGLGSTIFGARRVALNDYMKQGIRAMFNVNDLAYVITRQALIAFLVEYRRALIDRYDA